MSQGVMAIAGATGLVGAAAVEIAVSRGWSVVALVRPGRRLEPRVGVDVIEADFEALPALTGRLSALAPTAFLCALGTTIRTAGSQAAFARVDRDYVVAFAALGAAAGATRFGLVSAVGADAGSRNFYLRTKGEAETAVRSAGYGRVEIARPSFLTGIRAEHRLGETIAVPVATALGPLLVGGLAIYRPIAAATVAKALVAGLERREPGAFVRYFSEMTRMAAG